MFSQAFTGARDIPAEALSPVLDGEHRDRLQERQPAGATGRLGAPQLRRLSIVQVLLGMMDARGCGTWGHGQRVARYALATALQLHLPAAQIEGLYFGSLLHDVGKLCLSDAVLNRPGPFQPTDWRQMKSHPQHGYRILRGTVFLETALPVVLYHHEHFDGTGYPFHMNGRQIPRVARICAVADAYDAMTTDRPYHGGIEPEIAAQEIIRCCGSQFDPEIADAFLVARAGGFPLGRMAEWAGLRLGLVSEGQA